MPASFWPGYLGMGGDTLSHELRERNGNDVASWGDHVGIGSSVGSFMGNAYLYVSTLRSVLPLRGTSKSKRPRSAAAA